MRNLKKVLSLVLCVAMMLSVMVVGAGAAFADQNKITHTEAVDMAVALKIIDGKENNKFDPTGNVTRAEMCKMICVALNGGKAPVLGSADKTSFTDTKGHWAAAYIEACFTQGIVSGVGDNKFEPEASVTPAQAAKMLLVALGYKSGNEGFTGPSWSVKVNIAAAKKHLYDELVNVATDKAMNRDDAAQMIYNALNANMVEYKTDLVNIDGQWSTQITVQDKDPKITLLEDKYEALAITGTLTDVKQDNGKSTYNITVENAKYNGSTYNGGKVTYTDVAKDYSSLQYQTVRVLVKPDKSGKDAVVYGVYATSKNTVQTGLLADLKMDGSKAKLDGTKYDLASAKDTMVYLNGVKVTDASYDTIVEWIAAYGDGGTDKFKTYKEGTSVQLLATDGTTNYSILKVTDYAVTKVTYVGSDYINTNLKKFENDDAVIAKDLKKDDYVVVIDSGNYADGDTRIEKATVVEGKVDGIKGSDKVQIKGDWYTMATGVKQPTLNSNVKLILVNGYAYDKDTVSAGTEDIALLVELGNSNTVGSKYYQARVIFSDGSDKVVNVEKKDGDGNTLTVGTNSNTLVSYDVSKDVYTVTPITSKLTAEGAGYTDYKNANTVTIDGSIRFADGRVYLEDTAPVFVKYKTDDYKVVTGKAAAAWKSTTTSSATALTTMDGNTVKGSVAFLNLTGTNIPGGSTTKYAVALDGTYSQKIDGTTYYFTKAWNGTEEVTYKSEDSAILAKGDVFEFSTDGADTVSVDKVKMTNTQVKTYSNGDISFKDAITYTDPATSATDLTLKAGDIRSIDSKDTVVLFVDSNKNKGVGNGEIRVGNAFNSSNTDIDKPNVSVNLDYSDAHATDGYVTVIVVDVNNNYTQW